MILQELSHLPRLLNLARFLVSNFNRQLEVVEADGLTVIEFLHQRLDIHDRNYIKPLVDLFMVVLNKLKLKLFEFNW